MAASSQPAAPTARTTPRWLQVPYLLLILALAAFFANSYRYALGKKPDDWGVRHPHLVWFGGWQMFTTRDRTNEAVEGFAKVTLDGTTQWVAIDLETLFPAEWESGKRYQRRNVRYSQTRLPIFASAVCGRMEAHPDMPTPDAVRIIETSWRKTLGQVEQPRTTPKGKSLVKRQVELISWSCDRQIELPRGRRL